MVDVLVAERTKSRAPEAIRAKLRLSTFAGVLAGAVFGYAAGVIAAAGLQLTSQFDLTAVWMSIVASALLLGALIGASVVSRLERRYSTRALLAAAATIAGVGALLSAVVPAGAGGAPEWGPANS